MHPEILIEDLTFHYPNRTILKNIFLQVNSGQFIGLIGPNGGGKTTLLKLIIGFLKPTRGTIKIFGEPPNERSNRHISYVPQVMQYDRQFPISVLEVVLSGLLFQLPWHGHFLNAHYQKAHQILEQVGLLNYSNHPFGTLSGGQAQRVLIARALVSNPKLLLLDEPTASVDSQAEADIYSILKELKGKMTIVMVTHDLHAAMEHVEDIYCVQGDVTHLKPEQVCEHFAIGLYHKPTAHNILKRPTGGVR